MARVSETTAEPIPPKDTWPQLSISQLYDVQMRMNDVYYNMRRLKASYASQYAGFLSEIGLMIQMREAERASAERE